MTLLTGYPKVVLDVQDRSIIKDTPIGGIIAVSGVTRRGKAATPYFVGNPIQFTRLLGGQFPDDDDRFPYYCLRMLEAGAKLWVVPIHHYTTISDPATVEGTAATIQIGTTNNSVWTAEEVGEGYNGTTIEIVDAASGTAAKFDITITLTDSDVSTQLVDVDQLPDAAGIAAINLQLEGLNAGVVLTSVAGTGIVTGTGTLASGARVIGDLVAADFNGDAAAKNGWYAFDIITNAFRIANIGVEDPVVDEALRVYTEARADMRYHIATPLGVNATGIEAYRDGTTPYSHTAHNSYYGSLVAADINVTDTRDSTKKFDIPGLVDALSGMARKDVQYGPWYSAAGPKRGQVISPSNGISPSSVNLIAGTQQASFDSIYLKGVNAMVEDEQFGLVYWGNRSLLQDRTKLLSKDNVADLVVYLQRVLLPIARSVMFEPTLPSTWKELYRKVLPTIQELENNNAIEAGEDVNWFWQGDQNASSRSDVVFNNLDDLNSGRYKARFVFVPITATEYIGLELVATDSNSVKFVVQEGLN